MGRLLKKKKRVKADSKKIKSVKNKWQIVVSGRAWKNTEKTLSRHGMSFPGVLTADLSTETAGIITPEHVRAVYLLHLAAGGVRADQKLSVELCRLPAQARIQTVTEYIILPSSVRRKSTALTTKSIVKDAPGFYGGLYKNLQTHYDEMSVQELINNLPVTRVEISLTPEFYIPAWFNVTSVFALLMLECSRLGLREEHEQLSQIASLFSALSSPGLEHLADALFFSIVTPCIAKELTFSEFFKKDKKMKTKGRVLRLKAIAEYIEHIDNEYTHPVRKNKKPEIQNAEKYLSSQKNTLSESAKMRLRLHKYTKGKPL